MDFEKQRRKLVSLLRREVRDARVLDALGRVPRELFVPLPHRHLAYENMALPIEEGQTVSQPLMVAAMLAALELKPSDRALEVGTGSGYQAAALSLLAREVVSVERLPALVESARERLASLGYGNVRILQAGDVLGCPELGPYDAIVVAAGGPLLPRALIEQLAEGGRLVIPVGSRLEQQLMKVIKTKEGYFLKTLGACRFVPLVGMGAWEDEGEGGE
ncbi:MAG: protein-L-isoaspartate(D-aspartate) O-methyltransferase, partial [Chloroflexi bacterium]|nr:protein-L-isoaspartate(D-aspartate) O-methyltransferase [Chloroflexota bacterium]